ncbi:Putative metallopeptidase, catalytic domain superfamily [Septoria linicola]|uniref:Metallopeptidase, catalytic domain superfamily n=1 Tax=Septoria linicola TaxID=215465 RepID=A0A9Q9AWU0_9PEZI|nr:Putative metallopeptidase, catalytic domain superfamily [Septoria linicola]
MPFFLSTAGLSLTLLSAAHAAPRSLLHRRMEVNYVDCSDDQKTRLNTGFADAASLARIAYDMDKSSTAFTHYLRDEDGDYANKLWSMVAANNDPTNAPYTFSVRCAASCTGGEAESLAITDSAPQLDDGSYREMKICPLFFTAANTKNNLDSKKYDGDKRGSWCQKGQHFKDFETAGHTLLHEMTHLDALAKAAGLPEHTDPTGLTSHATDDQDPADYGNDYVVAARAFLKDWVEDPGSFPDAALKPYQNAENIAAAATENWFIKSCGFVDISL